MFTFRVKVVCFETNWFQDKEDVKDGCNYFETIHWFLKLCLSVSAIDNLVQKIQ